MSARPAGPPPGETQPERTALAWQRTGLGVLAVGGLLAHAALTSHRISLVVLAGAVAVLALAVLGLLAPVRYRQVRHTVAAEGGASAAGQIAVVAGIVLITGLAGVTAVVLLLR